MEVNSTKILGETIGEVMDWKESHNLLKKGEINHSDYENQIRYSVPVLLNSIIKNTLGVTGLFMAGNMAHNYYNILVSGAGVPFHQYITENPIQNTIIGLCTSAFLMFTLADRYKETLKYDAKNRAFYIEDLTKNIEIKDLNGVTNGELKSNSDYLYFRMMNRIITIDGFVDKGIGGIVEGVKKMKESFLKMKNFSENITHKAFDHILEAKIVRNIIGDKKVRDLQMYLDIYLKDSHINTFNKSFVTSISKYEGNKNLHAKLSKIALNEYNNTKPSSLKKILVNKNEQALTDTYNIDMNQRLVLKFSKMVFDAIKNKKINLEELSRFEELANLSSYKNESGKVKNDVHVEISKMAKLISKDSASFYENNKKKTFVDIVKKLDNLMVKQNKVIIRDFKDIFFSVREQKLNNTLHNDKNFLQKSIQAKLQGREISEKDVYLDSDIKTDNKLWAKAKKRMKNSI